MKVGMVVVNYNDLENAKKYIELVADFGCIERIAVVDNCSTNIKKEEYNAILSQKVDVVFSEKNAGYAAGNNLGIDHLNKTYGEFDYIIISNSDIFIEEKSIIHCIDILEKDKGIAIAAPRMYYNESTPAKKSSWKSRRITDDMIVLLRILKLLFYPKFKSSFYSESEFAANDILEVDSIAGSFFIARNSAFKEVGYFDENTFLYYEEDILGRKLKEKGYKIISVNTEKFLHFESQTINKVFNSGKKQKILFSSLLYYHKQYNHANGFVIFLFGLLFLLQKTELFFTINLISLLKKKERNV